MSIWKAPTCLTLLSPVLVRPHFVGLMGLVLRSRGSGVTGAAVRARSVTGAIQRLAHEPFRWRPTVLEMALRRYRCTGCGRAWHQGDSCSTAEP